MKFFVVGVLQQEVEPYEWRYVDAVVDASREGVMQAALEAGARVARETWHDWEAPERTHWNYWLLAVVELAPGLPVPYTGAETYMPGTSDMESTHGSVELGSRWVAAGQTEDGDTWVQRLRARSAEQLLLSVRDFLGDAVPGGAYGLVEERGVGGYAVYAHEKALPQLVDGAA